MKSRIPTSVLHIQLVVAVDKLIYEKKNWNKIVARIENLHNVSEIKEKTRRNILN